MLDHPIGAIEKSLSRETRRLFLAAELMPQQSVLALNAALLAAAAMNAAPLVGGI